MSYKEAMEAAGAEVIAYEEFGSYQGDWWAKVLYKGEIGWVKGSFGSCCGCDAFQAEFDYAEADCADHAYDHQDDCAECQQAKSKYDKHLAEFGRGYLDDMLLSQEEAEKIAAENIEWDSDAQEMVDWLKANAITSA